MAEQDPTPLQLSAPDVNEEASDVSMLDLLLALAQRKAIVLGVPLAAGIIAAIVTFLMPNWYTGTTTIMPPQQSQSNAVAILGQLGLAAGAASQAVGLRNPSDIYVAMLKSRRVADSLVTRFDLKSVYARPLLGDARRQLAQNSSIRAGREGIITIEVEDTDPQRAANLANGYIDELRTLTLGLAVSEAGQRRLFFEGQLKAAKNTLIDAEIELKKFTQTAGLVSPQSQLGLTISAAAALRAQITAKEIYIASLKTFATEKNPDVTRAYEELAGLRAELAKMEKGANLGKGDVLVPFGKSADVNLDYVRKFRDMKYSETLYEILARQYEIARIDEAKDATLIQVIDAAVVPERKTKPKRTLIVIAVGLVALLLGIILALAHYFWLMKQANPEFAAKVRSLQEQLRMRTRT